jgi:hypothetical protein
MIEDVDYLIQNSLEDSQILWIDSAARNRLHFPQASDFVVKFDQPLRLVFGFDVLDASIPVTMYNVDKYNNDIYMLVATAGPSAYPAEPDVCLGELSKTASFVRTFNGRDGETVEMMVVAAGDPAVDAVLSDLPPEVANGVAGGPHQLYRRRLWPDAAGVVQPRALQAEEDHWFFRYDGVEYAVSTSSPATQPLVELLEAGEFALSVSDVDGSVTVVCYEKVDVPSEVISTLRSANAYLLAATRLYLVLEPGNYDITSIVTDINALLQTTTVQLAPTTVVPRKQGRVQFVSSQSYALVDGSRGDLAKSLGFDTHPQMATDGARPWRVGDNDFVFGSKSFELGGYSNATEYRIVSPGLCALLGERFVMLRIKELEEHMAGSSFITHAPGIAMCKLAAPFGSVSNLRFDYSTALRKPFHPIGKLSQLSVRFETQAGRLYDFRNVNVQLMVCVKYYVPILKARMTRSILNPSYDANLARYLSTHRGVEYREETDQEEEEDDDDDEQTAGDCCEDEDEDEDVC